MTLNMPVPPFDPEGSHTLPTVIASSRFAGRDGVTEFHYLIRPGRCASFSDQLDWIEQALDGALAVAGLTRANVVFRRLFCSDLPVHAAEFEKRGYSPSACGGSGATSLVNQPPQPPSKVSMWAYCIDDHRAALSGQHCGNCFLLERGELTHVWTTGLAAPSAGGSFEQTEEMFKLYIAGLHQHGMRLDPDLIRTWLLVKDIDANYAGMVAARNTVFARNGLTKHTHFVASTGIEGSHFDVRTRVLMDAYAIKGIRPGQVRHLQALSHLNPTHEYGVAFERATSVGYRDRTHVFVSGTASIDNRGNILHEGNVLRQLDRVFENVGALLAQAGATLDDMQHIIAYVRDPADAAIVRTILNERVGDKPFEILIAAVCRPGWLVELEGMACLPAQRPEMPAF